MVNTGHVVSSCEGAGLSVVQTLVGKIESELAKKFYNFKVIHPLCSREISY